MSLPSIILSGSVGSASTGLARDIAFVRKDGGNIFYLSLITSSSTLDFEELINQGEHGGAAGIGICKITGDILFFQNDKASAQNLIHHNGMLFDFHILFANGDVVSTVPVNTTNGKIIDPTSQTLARYPLIKQYRPLQGVSFALKDGMGGGRGLHYAVTGNTAEKFEWHVKKTADFYKCFPLPSIPVLGGGGA